MHEQHLMRDVMQQIESVAVREHAAEVVRVRIWLGALSHFSAASFADHFRRLAAGGCAQGASLELTKSGDIHHPDAQGVVIESIDINPQAADVGAGSITSERSSDEP